jgi:hypothetical protein
VNLARSHELQRVVPRSRFASVAEVETSRCNGACRESSTLRELLTGECCCGTLITREVLSCRRFGTDAWLGHACQFAHSGVAGILVECRSRAVVLIIREGRLLNLDGAQPLTCGQWRRARLP